MGHKKRINTPKSWPIKKKENKYVVRPSSGPHTLEHCLPITVLLKEMLKYVKTTREARKVLNDGKLLVNGRVVKDHRFPVGLMDNLSFPEINEYYKLTYNTHQKFQLEKITKDLANLKTLKIVNKTVTKQNKTQLNFFNGHNLIVKENGYKVGDTLIVDDKNQVKNHLKFAPGAKVYIIDGSYVGEEGIVEKITARKGVSPSEITFKQGDKSLKTLTKYAFVVEK